MKKIIISTCVIFVVFIAIAYTWFYKEHYTPETPKALMDLDVCISRVVYGGSSEYFSYLASTCSSKKNIAYLSSKEIKYDVVDYIFPKMNLRYVPDPQVGPPLVVISGAGEILDGDFDSGDAYLKYDKKAKKFKRIK